MKRITIFIVLSLSLFIYPISLQAQEACVGNFELNSQSEVDTFNCTSVTGDLIIFGEDIINLDGLSALTSVGGSLEITYNDALTNVDGLSALISVGGTLEIWGNNALTNIKGLAVLTMVNSIFIWQNYPKKLEIIMME